MPLTERQRTDYSSHMKMTSVTELKNQLSAKLKQVMAGESLLVTDRNKPVAVLHPLHGEIRNRRLEGLVAAGLVAPPQEPLDVKGLLKLKRGRCKASLSKAICEDREGR